jgi:hypothetical protein
MGGFMMLPLSQKGRSMSTQLTKTEEKIEQIKQELMTLGPMRPGSITRQYRLPKEKKRPFYQISYQSRSHSEYVRKENLQALRQETKTYRRFRKLIDRWVELSIKASKLRSAEDRLSH